MTLSAWAGPTQINPDWRELPNPARKPSTAADAIALACAAGLLVLALWFRGPELLNSGKWLTIAVALPLAFAITARLARGVSISGAFAGAVIAFISILASPDLRMFWALLILFAITLAATRVGRDQKQKLKVAEAESGRSASQVMANLGVMGLALAIPEFKTAYLMALSALAEVSADTISSEIGTANVAPTVLITTWKAVPPGTNGGISIRGTAAGLFGAAIIASTAAALRLIHGPGAFVIACAGIFGMLVDSLLGAMLERRGYLSNDLVNLLSTVAAAGLAWTLS
ncbi:MAG TPA: DUF92 domain-containing protein [Candidatus Angelobacter sp.]|nr:DUF92 domain-containing protein [Candidatus Angelobacter sp.]